MTIDKAMVRYKYDVNECDVADKNQLTAFREKRTEWFFWFEQDEQHSIQAQIHSLMWNDAIFRSLNEARRFAAPNNPTAAVNGSLCEFIDIGYVASQVIGICKLIDSRNDVISLARLMNDISAHQKLITREHFVSFDGLPYDFDSVRDAQFAHLSPEERGEVRWIATAGPDAWGASELAHSAFDKLAGIARADRQRTDLINQRAFDTINGWLEEPIFEGFKVLRNKFVAHAADKPSRQTKPLDRLGLSLDGIKEAQKKVVEIATAVGSYILYGPAVGGVVPTPQFNVFEKLDLPLVPAEKMPEMGNWWHQHETERESWSRDPFGFYERSAS